MKKIKDKNTLLVIKNIIISFGIKGGSLFIALFTTSAYITYFSNDSILGVWFTLLSILAWMLNFDLGIGNGLRNKLVKSWGEKNLLESKKYISSAYVFLTLIIIIIFGLGSLCIEYIPWNNILGISTDVLSLDTLILTIRIVFFSIALQFVLRIIISIAYALQVSYLSGFLSFVTNSILLIYVLLANNLEWTRSIENLAVIYLFAVNIPLLISTLVIFGSKLKELRPNYRYFSKTHALETVKLGGIFLYLQIIAMMMNNTANFLIAYLISSEQVVEYQLYYKVYHLVSTIIILAMAPMWSAITKAVVEKRYEWLRKTLKIMLLLVILVFIMQMSIIPVSQLIFNVWLGENSIAVNYTTAFIFAIYGAMYTWQHVCSYISNGLNILKIQIICMSLGVLISLIFAFVFSDLWQSYVAITVGMILGFIPFCVVQTIWTLNYCRVLKKYN
ncbi:MAG: hypothetical protein R3Y24_15425 [Eubacteriales bacterium]